MVSFKPSSKSPRHQRTIRKQQCETPVSPKKQVCLTEHVPCFVVRSIKRIPESADELENVLDTFSQFCQRNLLFMEQQLNEYLIESLTQGDDSLHSMDTMPSLAQFNSVKIPLLSNAESPCHSDQAQDDVTANQSQENLMGHSMGSEWMSPQEFDALFERAGIAATPPTFKPFVHAPPHSHHRDFFEIKQIDAPFDCADTLQILEWTLKREKKSTKRQQRRKSECSMDICQKA
uniref:Uncharacterized protein n=1 Tax=Percolomonas cosmopolitus TaxID=63605 RepID=A0A7S1KU98_9EUKA